jgi:hypothetical protein
VVTCRVRAAPATDPVVDTACSTRSRSRFNIVGMLRDLVNEESIVLINMAQQN